MAINFDKALGIHPDGMVLRAKRAEIIASNIANADTPGYKAKGMDFQDALASAAKSQQMGMSRTHTKHYDTRIELNSGTGYRVPDQPDTGDGNTVNVQVERNLYLENSLQYQASVNFLDSKVKGLKKAISGGQ
ncbi:MAG: flagellar basal body rod protein FlgB [Thalassotalea sp.]|nr:flagellar basal body rod protein FlgB [Thalassotalea sp.]